MHIIRRNKNWLRQKVTSTLRNEHRELYGNSLKEKYLSFIKFSFDKKRWWLITLIVIFFFCLPLIIQIDLLNFINISFDTAKIIVDQRAANIATIISITLVVVGFLINNLAVKEGFVYQILFRHSYLYPIIYFTLSTIGCFFIISMLREEIGSFYFIRLVNIGTYFAIIILFLIGFLFKTIIQFTNDKTIWKLLHHELMEESTAKLKRILLNKYSKIEFNKQIQQTGVKLIENTYPFQNLGALFSKEVLTDEKIKESKLKERYVFDINIEMLRKTIQEKDTTKGVVNCLSLSIEELIQKDADIIWQEGISNIKKEKSLLKKSCHLKKLTDSYIEKDQVRKYFDQKLELLSSISDHRNLKDLLDSYIEIYQLQMKHQQ
jgi:hypothetical protein